VPRPWDRLRYWLQARRRASQRRDLRARLGARTEVFSYPSVARDVGDNARALSAFLTSLTASRLDLVAHSLGGLVVLKCLELRPPAAPGRVVLLGSPLQGSATARSLARVPLLKAILGRGITQESVTPEHRSWRGSRELGVIAGNLPLGLGQLFASLDVPHDGTVAVQETELPGAADRIVLPVSHTGMVFSPKVSYQCACFLDHGHFDHDAA